MHFDTHLHISNFSSFWIAGLKLNCIVYNIKQCINIGQNNLYWASLPRISANSNKNYRHYNFQASANISGNIKFPENLQPYSWLIVERDPQTSAEMSWVRSVLGPKCLDTSYTRLQVYAIWAKSRNKLYLILWNKACSISCKKRHKTWSHCLWLRGLSLTLNTFVQLKWEHSVELSSKWRTAVKCSFTTITAVKTAHNYTKRKNRLLFTKCLLRHQCP